MELTLSTMIFRLALGVVLSAIIGCERSIKRHSAGLRTFMIMALAASSARIFELSVFNGVPFVSGCALVATASISVHSLFRNARNQIQGLTTAAALWVCCVIGLSSGAGLYSLSIASTVVLIICLTMMPGLESYLKNHSNHFEIHLELNDSRHLSTFITTVRKLGLTVDDIEFNRSYKVSNLSVYSIAMTIVGNELKRYKTHKEIVEALSTLDYVSHIEEM